MTPWKIKAAARWIGAMAILLIAACGGGTDLSEQLAAADKPSVEQRFIRNERLIVKGSVQLTEPEMFVNGVGVRALAKGNEVNITISNRREKAFLVHPRQFGVYVDGELIQVDRESADYRAFQAVDLQPGVMTGGVIRFPGLESLEEAILVYYNPEVVKPFKVPIEAMNDNGEKTDTGKK